MDLYKISLSLILILLFTVTGAHALDTRIPKEGVVFVGENGIDISECNVRAGDEIAFWSSGFPEGTPDSRARVMDPRNFFVDPLLFELYALENCMLNFDSFGTSMRFDNKAF